MSNLRYCRDCQDYIPKLHFNQHMNQHNIGNPAIEHKQFTGKTKNENDYLICVLHQKKVPCPVKNCHCKAFGIIRKSYMMKCVKDGYFPHTVYHTGEQVYIGIDREKRTVKIMGVTIHLRI